MSSYSLRKAAVEKFNSENYWKKKGLAVVPLKFPIGLGSVAAGQGALVVSRELRMPMSNIHLRGTSTETVPNTNISGGSVVADLNGLAVKVKIIAMASKSLASPVHKLLLMKTLAFQLLDTSGYESNMNGETGEGHPFKYFVFGAACSKVETDYLTGARKNTRTDIVMDVGCSINPALDIGQIEGMFIRGMGLYTIEELNYSPQGVLYTRGPNQYKIPAICDIPTELHISLLPLSQSSNTLYSLKGLGESGIFLGCSVFFALHDAVKVAQQERGLSGPLKLNSPLTPEKIRMACEDKFTKMETAIVSDSNSQLHCPNLEVTSLAPPAALSLWGRSHHRRCRKQQNQNSPSSEKILLKAMAPNVDSAPQVWTGASTLLRNHLELSTEQSIRSWG
ncbi:Aldehyde oxidase 1 [Vulpes lagopus]